MPTAETLHCPECATMLTASTEPSMLVCPRQHGAFVHGDASKQLITVDAGVSVEELAQRLGNPGPRKRPCVRCGQIMRSILIHQADIDLCSGCASAWLPAGALPLMTGGRRPEPAPQIELDDSAQKSARSMRAPTPRTGRDAAREPSAPSGRGPMIVIAALVAFFALGGAAVTAYFLTRSEPEVAAAQTPLELYDKYGSYFVGVAFGGQTLQWWRERLESLAPGGSAADEDAFALTTSRAAAAGLLVKTADGIVEVVPDDRMKIALVKRMKLDR